MNERRTGSPKRSGALDDLEVVAAGRRMTWPAQLIRIIDLHPDKAALRSTADGRTVTYAQLSERAHRLARALADRGINEGDRIAIVMSNRPEFVEALLATSLLGAIAVPANFRLVADELAYILADSGAAAVLADSGTASLVGRARAGTERAGTERAGTDLRALIVVAQEHERDAVAAAGPGAQRLDDVVSGTSAEPVDVDVAEDRPALIMYTSGTTGRPKGAVLTYLNLLAQSFTLIRAFRWWDGAGVNLCAVPMFHIGALGSLLPALTVGVTTVIMPSAAFDPDEVLDVLERERVTAAFLVPAQWQAVCGAAAVRERDLALEVIAWGAAPATTTLLEAMTDRFPAARVVALFGQTEMSAITCMLDGPDAIRKIGSVGKPVPSTRLRIVDESMKDVAAGEVGEAVYRGGGVMLGYWNNPTATAEAFRGGWFHSGDLVRRDEEGFLYVVDRTKDMIISGGENIYSAEVEQAIDGHPKVREVAVIGVAHPKWTETPIAVVAPVDPTAPPTLDEILDWCRGRLASYRKPSAVVVLDELPRNAAGKVLKHELRHRYRDLLVGGTS